MFINFACPHCSAEIEADDGLLGTQRKCPGCDELVDVPTAHVGPGVQLAGFRIEDRLGKGGMGEVFLAEQISMGRKVAIKVLPPEMTSNKEAVDRFLHEARMSARLEHPNVVTVLDAGEDCGFYYLAMQYVDGETLEDRVKNGVLPESEALTIMKTVLQALDHVWTHHNILHRDIKPANLMEDKFSKIQILDMGLAKAMLEDSNLTVSGTIVGTPYYMSPEQAKTQKDLDFRADLYSVAATVYHLLTGAPPFEGDSVVTILTQHVLEDVPPIQARNQDISDPCARFLEICLEKDPDDRFESYGAAVDAIDRVLDGQMPTDESVTKKKPGVRFKRKRRTPPPIQSPKTLTAKSSSSTPAPPKRSKAKTLLVGVAVIIVLAVVGSVGIIAISGSASQQETPEKVEPEETIPVPVVQDDAVPPKPPDPVAPPPDPEAERLAALQERHQELRQFVEANPLDFAETLRRYREFQPMVEGTPLAEQVEEEQEEQSRKRRKAITTVLDTLRKRAQARMREGDKEQAARILLEYDGPLAAETESLRMEHGRPLLEAAQREQEEERKRTESLAHYHDRLFEATDLLAKQRFPEARQGIEEMLRDPMLEPIREEMKDDLNLLQQIAQMDHRILQTFTGSRGKDVVVQLNVGKYTLNIKEVTPELVKANKVIVKPNGRLTAENNFTYWDLAGSERLRRLGRIDSPAKQAMKAILYLEAGKPAAARRFLEPLESDVTDALAVHMGGGAEFVLQRFLANFELPVDERDPDILRRVVIEKRFDQARLAELRQQAALILKQYGDDGELGPTLAFVKFAAELGDAGKDRPSGRRDQDPGPDVDRPRGIHPVPAGYQDPRDYDGEGAVNAIRMQRRTVRVETTPLELENSIGMVFRLVPAGVHVNGLAQIPEDFFYLGKHEVTQGQWRQIFPEHRFPTNDPDQPAFNLSYAEIQEFIRQITERDELPQGVYRLPSAAEWAYACKAGTRTRYYFGDAPRKLHLNANYLDRDAPQQFNGQSYQRLRDAAHSDGFRLLAPVGQFPPNPWGLCDMYGNVWEYVHYNKRVNFNYVLKGGSFLDPITKANDRATLEVDRDFQPRHDRFMPYGFRLLFDREKMAQKQNPENRFQPRVRRPFRRFP